MGKKRLSKRSPPSYEEGKLRDPSIEKMQDASTERADLIAIIKKAIRTPPKRVKSH